MVGTVSKLVKSAQISDNTNRSACRLNERVRQGKVQGVEKTPGSRREVSGREARTATSRVILDHSLHRLAPPREW